MLRFLIFKFSKRRAVSTIIAGMIILSVLLTALGAMVFVSQQYDQYQQKAFKIAQYEDQGQSENLVANSPGLQPNLAWNGCGGCNMYNMSLSNLGGVGVQIARIYITSTTSGQGCNPNLCILDPTSTATVTSSAFSQLTRFLNTGETNHAVILYLPSNIALPTSSATQSSPNTITIVTSRGSVFSFQWPFQTVIWGGQSQSAFSAGIVKIAYQSLQTGGYDSKNEVGPVNAGSGGTKNPSTYCHNEPVQSYPAGASYAEKLTVNNPSVSGGVLWFVSPWITQTIFNGAQDSVNNTMLFLYVNITNTGNAPYTVAGGSIDLTWWGSNHIDARLIGFYYGAAPGQFYAAGSAQTIAVGKSLLAIFRLSDLQLGTGSGGTWPPPNQASIMFWGSASLSSSTEDTSFVGGVALMSGVWVRYSC